MSYKCIIYEKRGGVARIILNRPEKLNATSIVLLDEMEAALNVAEKDNNIGVIILKGAGRAFSAGNDMTPTAEDSYYDIRTPLDDLYRNQRYERRSWVIRNLHKPVIAQVHGYCLAMGMDIAGACDIIIAAENARFGIPDVRNVGTNYSNMIVWNAGLQWAKILAFTGDLIDGKQAERIGLVAKAVPEDKLEEEVNRLAERIALVPPEMSTLNKMIINQAAEEMGLRSYNAVAQSLTVMTHYIKEVVEFRKIAEEKGLKAALAAKQAIFEALPKPSFLEDKYD